MALRLVSAHEIALGADDTDPFPMPDIATDSPNFGATGSANVAVTECGWTIGTMHVAVVPLGAHAPPHPPNVLPPTADALNVTSVPGAKVAEHCPLADPETSVHPTPPGVELTVPLP